MYVRVVWELSNKRNFGAKEFEAYIWLCVVAVTKTLWDCGIQHMYIRSIGGTTPGRRADGQTSRRADGQTGRRADVSTTKKSTKSRCWCSAASCVAKKNFAQNLVELCKAC